MEDSDLTETGQACPQQVEQQRYVRIFRVTQLQPRNTEVSHPGPEAQVCLRQSRPLLYWTSGADHTLSFKY